MNANQQAVQSRRKKKRVLNKSAVAVYAIVFVTVVAVFTGGQYNQEQISLSSTTVTDEPLSSLTSVNDLVAVNIASNLAEVTQLSVALNVENLAVSYEIKSQLTQATDEVIAKPQILQPMTESRAVVNHIVGAGENVATIAAKYGLSIETVKFANNLTADNVKEGQTLQILPVDGVLYTVKENDTIEKIVERYSVDPARLVAYNDLELSGLVAETKIILPEGSLPVTERPGYVAPRRVQSYSPSYAIGGWGGVTTFLYWNNNKTSDGNRNAWGNCTWYVWERRQQIGGSYALPSQAIGNAEAWAYSLANMGYRVSRSPSVGAILQNGGGYGHVAIVESLAENGDIVVSEMNFGGWYNGVSRRVIPASSIGNYNYIHEKTS